MTKALNTITTPLHFQENFKGILIVYTCFITGVTEGTDIKALTDSDVITVSKKITTLEMKELNERQRAEHAVRMYEQQRSILQDVETRNKDLEEKFSEVCTSTISS